MTNPLVLTARTIITMDERQPRAEAVAVDTDAGTFLTIGTVRDVLTAHPDAEVRDLGRTVLAPGFVDAHSHPVLSGVLCMQPSQWIAPYVGFPTYADVTALFTELDATTPPGGALLFNGLDRSLHNAPELTATDLDAYFPSRPVVILDNSGHEAYFNTTLIEKLGWSDGHPPPDPVGARFGRHPDGTSNGRAYESTAVTVAALPVLTEVVTDPLRSAARWYLYMAENGITATSEHTYGATLAPAINALGSVPDSPMRVSVYHMSTESDAGETLTFTAPDDMVRKVGVKLWADGSPWVGTIATTVPYLDNEFVRATGITPGPGGEAMMNYSRADLDALLDDHAPRGWQMAFHANGDLAVDIVLDAYERALTEHHLIGTDHRWRIEHLGAARADQFPRAASLGVAISLAPFQFIYWGDLVDGTLFPPEVGSQWQRFGDAVTSHATVSFHNDGMVSPPIPLLNIQSAITRCTPSGTLHGPEQRISLDDALRAHTVNAARHLRRDDLGSITPGSRADLVELSSDPYEVDPMRLTEQVSVLGTWRGGRRIDLDAFLEQVSAIDPVPHRDLAGHATHQRHCC